MARATVPLFLLVVARVGAFVISSPSPQLLLTPEIGLVDISTHHAAVQVKLSKQPSAQRSPILDSLVVEGLFLSPAHLWSLLVATVGGAVLVVFWHRGPMVYLPIIIYIGALSTMTMALRNCFAYQGFDFPRTVTAIHFASTCLVAAVWINFRRVVYGEQTARLKPRSFFYGIVPSAVAFAASLAFSNIGIAKTNGHFYEMVETSTPLLTAAFAVFMGKTFPPILLIPLSVCVLGMTMCWTGEVEFSHWGFCFLLVGAFGRAVKGVLNQIMLSGSEIVQQLHPVELVFYMSGTCFLVMMPWAAISEFERRPFASIINPQTFAAVLVTAVNAVIINLSGTFVIKDLGAVGAQLVGNLKGVLSVMGAWALMHELVTRRQVLGYAVMVTGIFVYNKMNLDLARIPSAKDAEKGPLLPGTSS